MRQLEEADASLAIVKQQLEGAEKQKAAREKVAKAGGKAAKAGGKAGGKVASTAQRAAKAKRKGKKGGTAGGGVFGLGLVTALPPAAEPTSGPSSGDVAQIMEAPERPSLVAEGGGAAAMEKADDADDAGAETKAAAQAQEGADVAMVPRAAAVLAAAGEAPQTEAKAEEEDGGWTDDDEGEEEEDDDADDDADAVPPGVGEPARWQGTYEHPTAALHTAGERVDVHADAPAPVKAAEMMFRQYDASGDGFIDAVELQVLLPPPSPLLHHLCTARAPAFACCIRVRATPPHSPLAPSAPPTHAQPARLHADGGPFSPIFGVRIPPFLIRSTILMIFL